MRIAGGTCLCAVAFLDLFAVSMILTVLPTFMKDSVGISASLSGTITSLYGFVQFFSSPFIGDLSDRKGYRHTFLLCLTMCIPAYCGLISHWWPLLIASRVMAGVFKQTQNLCKSAAGAIIPAEQQLGAFGHLNAMGNLGYIIGPAIAGVLLDGWHQFHLIFICGAGIFALNALMVQLFFDDHPKHPDDKEKGVPKVDEASLLLTGAFKRLDWAKHWDVMATRFLFSLAALLYRSNFNWFLTEKFAVAPSSIAYLTSFQGVASFFASYHAARICRLFPRKEIFYCVNCAILAPCILALVICTTFETFVVLIGLFCILTSFMRAVSYNLSCERSERSEIGLMMGVSGSVVSGSRALAPMIGGAFHDIHRNVPGLMAVGVTLIALMINFNVTLKKQPKFLHTAIR